MGEIHVDPAVVQTGYLFGHAPPHMTPEECERIGGHCFREVERLPVLAIYPPVPGSTRQRCPHCGKTRIATPRHGVDYRDE